MAKNELFGFSYDKHDKNSSGLSADKLKEIELLYDDLKNEITNLYEQTIFLYACVSYASR